MANQNYATLAPDARMNARMADYNKYVGKKNAYQNQLNAYMGTYNGAVNHLNTLNTALMNAVVNHGMGSPQALLAQANLDSNMDNIATVLNEYQRLQAKIANNENKRVLAIS